MNEIKYTTDGKKVVVIGNLNNQEKIVQEIFVTSGGVEVPSGENFVVKSLHDEPVISWKEKKVIEVDKMYKKEHDQRLDEMYKLREQHKVLCEELRSKMSFINKMCDKVSPETFDLLTDFISENIKYVVEVGYGAKIIEWKDFKMSNSYGLKLVTIFGQDDGSLVYGLNYYSDGSGGHTRFIPCRTFDDALEVIKRYLSDQKSYGDSDIELAKKYGLALDDEKLKTYKENRIKEAEKSMQQSSDNISKMEARISEINNI